MSKCKDCKHFIPSLEGQGRCEKACNYEAEYYLNVLETDCCDEWEEGDDKMEERCETCTYYRDGLPVGFCKLALQPAFKNGHCDGWSEYVEDQDIKADKGKPQLTLVPLQIIYDIARTREYGVMKYGEKESWKKVSKERYRDALFRHVLAYLKDPEGVDEESGLPHLSHVAVNVAFLCELEKE